MSEIDWSKAPEDATHCSPEFQRFRQLWAKQIDGVWQYHTGVGGWYYGAQPSKEEKYIPRPSPAWSGEGLPPVGVVCEYRSGYVDEPFEYSQCEIIAHFEGEQGKRLAAFKYTAHDGVVQLGRGTPKLFRPIRTTEQIAADEREAACEEMLEIAKSRRPDPDVYEAIATLYDAGFRKP